jgi:hypothetical protein
VGGCTRSYRYSCRLHQPSLTKATASAGETRPPRHGQSTWDEMKVGNPYQQVLDHEPGNNNHNKTRLMDRPKMEKMTARDECDSDRVPFKYVCYGIRNNTSRYYMLSANPPFPLSLSQAKGAERESQVSYRSLNCKCKPTPRNNVASKSRFRLRPL